MTLTYVLNGNPDGARTFLRALETTPFQAERARRYLAALDRDHTMGSDPLVARVRPLMLRKDYVGEFGTGQVLEQCLDANPSNRMAFEYLLAHYLLTSDMEAFGRMAPRSLADTDSTFVAGLAATSQSVRVVPRNRMGDAPMSLDPISGESRSFTPATFRVIPVLRGNRPDMVLAWPVTGGLLLSERDSRWKTALGVAFVPKGALDAQLELDAVVALHGSKGAKASCRSKVQSATLSPPKLVVVRFQDGQAVRVDDLVTGFQSPNGKYWARPAGVAVGPDGMLYFSSDSETKGLFRLKRTQ